MKSDGGTTTGSRSVPEHRPPAADGERDGDARLLPVAPRLVRSALGLALGTVFGLTLSAIAAVHAVFDFPGEDPIFVWLLGGSYLPGYAPTLRGAVAGLVWGMIAGFSLGWLLAWARDTLLRLFVSWVASRERLRANGRVLDEML